jgi:hypothetical protein
LQGSVDHPQGFDSVRVEPRPNIQTNVAPIPTPRSAAAFTPRAPPPRLPPLLVALVNQDIQLDLILPEAHERVISVPRLAPATVSVVDWERVMQITNAEINPAGLTKNRLGVLLAELGKEDHSGCKLYVEMNKLHVLNVEAMAIEQHDVKMNTIPLYLLKIIALSIKDDAQNQACQMVFELWQKCTASLEGNLEGEVKEMAKARINERIRIHAKKSSFLISKLHFGYRHIMASDRTSLKIKELKGWCAQLLCKDTIRIVHNAVEVMANELYKIHEEKNLDIDEQEGDNSLADDDFDFE